MKTILVPLDGSEMAEKALQFVEKMVAPEIELLLVRVVNPLAAATGAVSEAEYYLARAVDRWSMRHPEMGVRSMVLEGLSAEKIIDAAEEQEAGLVVMTTHGAGGLGRWLVGSVAEKVVRHAPCPVLIVGRRTLEAMD